MTGLHINSDLTNRELQVVDLLANGNSNKQIAATLNITERTVEFHLTRIYGKLQDGSRTALLAKLRDSTVADSRPRAPMTFYQAVRIWLINFATFEGRASRAEFWWFVLFVTIVAGALAYVSEGAAAAFTALLSLPIIAAGIRRLRDTGKSGWWQLFLLAPVGGLVIVGTLWAMPTQETAAIPLRDEQNATAGA